MELCVSMSALNPDTSGSLYEMVKWERNAFGPIRRSHAFTVKFATRRIRIAEEEQTFCGHLFMPNQQ